MEAGAERAGATIRGRARDLHAFNISHVTEGALL